MRIAVHASYLAALTSLLAMGCQGTFGDGTRDDHADGETVAETPIPACPVDPDCAIGGDCTLYECPDYWLCDDLAEGGKRCTNPGPDYPDDGEWSCSENGRTIECRGDHYPDDGGGGSWNCERINDVEVVCTDNSPDYPDEPGDGPWNCLFEGEFRVCERGGGSGSGDGGSWFCYDTPAGRECRQRTPDYPDDRDWDCHDNSGGETVCSTPGDLPDDGGGSEWECILMGDLTVCTDDTPDYPDDGGETPTDCYFTDEFRVCGSGGGGGGGGSGECVAGDQRWCDDAIYCSWGKQDCLPDGNWGPCIEPRVTSAGLQDRPDTACGCRYFYFNDDCCEDQEDRDGDGHADCLIPDTHTAPACESDGSLCSYCDVAGDCGGSRDVCLFARDGYAFCAAECTSSADCGGGYNCQAVTTSSGRTYQCVPSSGTCG
ncbi:MAG: hypothetical protein JRH11_07095 [Deltaproteobacteria bacterium]|nr:hypothetical protein [Deltaproteobacteria bacterium]